MLSGSGAEPTEQQAAIGPVAAGMDAKLMVATASDDVQQLKNLVKQQEDSEVMVVVMAKQQAASAEKPHPQQRNMDPHLLALVSSGSFKKLESLLISREDGQQASVTDGSLPATRQTLVVGGEGQASGNNDMGDESLSTMRRACNDDIEAADEPILVLDGVTAEGNTALHVVAACGQGDKLFTRFKEAKHLLLRVQQNHNNRQPRVLTRAERHALTTYGDGENFLESAGIIYGKARHLLFAQNKNGDTPLHLAARAGKSNMVNCLIELAFAEGGEDRMKELLRKVNKHNETALHDAVRFGNNGIVDLLMDKDSELASFPTAQEDGSGASPMYLAIMLKRYDIVNTLYEKTSTSRGNLSFSGPNGQNALHAAVLRYPHRYRDDGGLARLLEWNQTQLCKQNKDLTAQQDKNGSTPLHFAAAIHSIFGPSRICQQVLKANPYALYQPDRAGFFPIHVAASVGASGNVAMFVTECPGSAGLRDAKGRTFLHVAAEKKKVGIISGACRNRSLSWITNMADNDGNTALHLAVEAGSLQMFCPLLANPQVDLNLPNNNGETPFDIAKHKIPEHGLYYNQNSEAQICRTLRIAGAVKGVHRCQDHLLDDSKTVRVKAHDDESKLQKELLKDSTQTLCIGSVLIATVTFGATFAVPGGYIADDHNNGGSPILARRYAFDAFIASNTLSFVFSAMATISLMRSGSPLFNPHSRQMHLGTAFYLVSISITSLAAAFAVGAYVVLAPVAHKTAVATCVIASLVLLYTKVEFIGRRIVLLPALRTRMGLSSWGNSALHIVVAMLFDCWPLFFIFGWAAYANLAPKIQAPLA